MRLFNIRTSRISASGLQFVDLVLTNSPETALLFWETTVRQDHQRETKHVQFPMKYTQAYPEQIQRRDSRRGGTAWLKCHLVQNDIDDDDFDDVSAGIRRQTRDLIRILLILLRPTSTHDCFHALPRPQVLPIVVFFSTVMSMLYYLGLMQWVIRKVLGLEGIGWRGYSHYLREKVLNAVYPGFPEVPFCLHQDSPPPPLPAGYWTLTKKILHAALEAILPKGLLMGLFLI